MRKVDPDIDMQAEIDSSIGAFYDRNKSLLWSLVINDNGGDHLRFNYFPDSRKWNGNFGFFLSHNADDSWSTGLLYKFGFGVAATH